MASGKINLEFMNLAGSKTYVKLSNNDIKTLPYDVEHTSDSIIFSNWVDNTNFPVLYGSGIILPCIDSSEKRLIYITGTPSLYIGKMKKNGSTVTITWKQATTN